jgi:predicted ATP-binding protein involved in virulence
MIRVKELHLENVGPFKAQDLDFSVAEGHPDIHIFTGINGTGKTTILHAIAAMFDHFEDSTQHREFLSNNFDKRFRFFELVDNDMPKSYVIGKISTPDNQSADTSSLICWGCPECRNIHKDDQDILRFGFGDNGLNQRTIEQLDSKSLRNFLWATGSKYKTQNTVPFAAFGYSGYRLLSSSPILLGNEDKFNPFSQALSFAKIPDSNFNISNWIVSRHASAAVESNGGNNSSAAKVREALDTLLRNIQELTESEARFSIQTQPWKLSLKYFDQEVEFDVLPDGLRSILSWMGDLLMRLDSISWVDKSIPVNEQRIILLLDEIEVHLHPKWQYQILPLTQKIFPNAQIFLTTHSPFILNSIDNAKIYKLKTERGEAFLDGVELSETGNSYGYVYENILETHNMFGYETMQDLKLFNAIDKEIAQQDFSREPEFIQVTQKLLKEGLEVTSMISSKLLRLKRITGKDYFHGENQEKAAV